MKIYYAYTKRLVTSYLFWIAIIGIGAITYFGMTEENSEAVVFAFNVMLDLSTYRKLMMFFAVLPFGMTYCREWNDKYAGFIMARIDSKHHLKAYTIMQFASSFTVTFIGIWLGIILLLTQRPIFIDDGNVYTGCFTALISQNKAILYLLFRSFHYAVSIATWSMSGLAISSIFLNSYLSVIAPLVFSYGLELVTIEAPFLPNLWYLSLSYTDFSKSPFISSLYIVFVFLIISIFFAIIFYKIARRRAQNEIH